MFHARTFPREDIETFIQHLAERYPACFFVNAAMKRPLKKNIILDLEKENALDAEQRQAAIGFYTRDWNYERTLQAGAERVDLNGKKVGTVTELEQMEAQQRVHAAKQARQQQVNSYADPHQVLRTLHEEGRIPDDQLRKLPAPPLAPLLAAPLKLKFDPALERLQVLLTNTNDVLQKSDPLLRTAVLTAALKVLVVECEKVIELTNGRAVR